MSEPPVSVVVPGEVRVFSEVHPREACMAGATCRLQGLGIDVSVPAKADMPFTPLLDKNAPEPLECFHTCLLPASLKGGPAL